MMIEAQPPAEQDNMDLLRENLSDPKMVPQMNNFQFSVNVNLSDPQMIAAFGRLVNALTDVLAFSKPKKTYAPRKDNGDKGTPPSEV